MKKSKFKRRLARRSQKVLKDWKKSNPNKKVLEVTRNFYGKYACLGVTFYEPKNGLEYWQNLFVF